MIVRALSSGTAQCPAMHVAAYTALCWALAAPCVAGAQAPVPAVQLGFGVDTTTADVGDVVRLMRAYLAQPDSTARARGLWSCASAFDLRVGDVTAPEAYQGFPATIIGVTGVTVEPQIRRDSAYVVKVLYARYDSAQRRIAPLALQRLYAVREPGGPFPFRLSGALPRLTRTWERRSVGRMTFWYAPGQQSNSAKIARAAHFVDSVASLFRVEPPDHMDVYVTASSDEAQRTIGLDFFPGPSGPGEGNGGLTLPHGIVLVGNPRIGEAYLHEFVHVILGPAFSVTSQLFAEGVATWLGGSQDRSPEEMYVALRAYQAAHPEVTLSDLLRKHSLPGGARAWTDVMYATGARVADVIYRRSGVDGLRRFAQVPGTPDSLLTSLPALLGLPASGPSALDRWWRTVPP
ncbi:MAG: hypothetical protein ACR2M1_04380 [Gemmatimonadaceae bacterium]